MVARRLAQLSLDVRSGDRENAEGQASQLYTYAEATRCQSSPDWARPYKPKDKAIAELLPSLNERPFQGREESRQDLFEAIDRPALRPLPNDAYEYAEWRKAKPGIDYRIEIDKRCYNVPHALVGQILEVCLTATTVEVMHKGRRVAAHPRYGKERYTTLSEHMPKSHREHREWSPGRFLNMNSLINH